MGLWSDKIQSRRFPIIITSCIAIIASSLILIGPHDIFLTIFCILLLGISGSGQSLALALVNDHNELSEVGTAIGLTNMLMVFSGALLEPITGLLLNHQTRTGYHNYSLADYNHALLILPCCGMIGLILSLFFIKDTYIRESS